jgi:YidC/Oxa1 family membrane protein insertase
MKITLTLVLVGFVVFCGVLVLESGIGSRFCGSGGIAGKGCILLQQPAGRENSSTANAPVPKNERLEAAAPATLTADHAAAKTVILGADDPNMEDPKLGFKLQLQLSSWGAAVKKATFSNGNDNGFDDRDYKNPKPLVILSTVNDRVLSMANTNFWFVQQQLRLRLNELHWKSFDVVTASDGSQTAQFEAVIRVKDTGESVVKLTKIYKVVPRSYLLDCNISVENLSGSEQEVRFDLRGPVGIGREGVRADMRKAVAGFQKDGPGGEISAARLNIKKLRKAKTIDRRRLTKLGANFLWAAVVNKYFAAILVPVPDEGIDFCNWVADKTGRFYNPDRDRRGDETVGVDLRIAKTTLASKGRVGCKRKYSCKLYLGPKDKSLFDKNEYYKRLGFVQTIDFMTCCCPASIIKPLAFGILALMKWLYGFIANYGVVIIILVFVFRIAIHPLTKKSQISMSKMGKLAPKAEEIKKKYANNKAEMNKQLMALYREQGASPIMGMLPMMVQMPIWIALWSAVYASIELRGAPFLPFWITDLSVPDALYRFPTPIVVPLLGWKITSLNLLPLLMGVAFYLQQKLMPKQAAAAANPQVAQQQKMMMIMLPLMFPLMLYNAPSGVNLYIMASTFAGVIEQYLIRKHIREQEEAESKGLVAATSKTGGKVKKKKPKPFFKT